MNQFKQVLMICAGVMGGALLSGYIVRQAYANKCHVTAAGHGADISSSIQINRALEKENLVDVVIIGSGPAGLSAALYASRFSRKTLVIQGTNQGGQLMGTSHVENWPGIEKVLGPELIERLRKQAASFGPMFMADAVSSVDLSAWPYTVKTENDITLHAMSIIIATGASPRKLGVPGEQEYWGRGVTTCAICDAPFYKGEEVVVVGGGDSAVEEAIQLAPYVKKVTMLVRTKKMRATPVMQKRIEGYPNIEIMHDVAIEKIVGDGVHVIGIDVINPVTKEKNHITISGVFLAIGHEPNTQLFNAKKLQEKAAKEIEELADSPNQLSNAERQQRIAEIKKVAQLSALPLNDAGYILMEGRSQATSVPGVFAAGDVEDDVYRQGGVASGNGIKAAIDADRFLAAIGLDKQMSEKLTPRYFVQEQEEKTTLPTINTLAEYTQALGDGSKPVILDFYTDSCSSCLQMLPVISAVAQQYADVVKVYKVDAVEATELVEKFLVYKVPCIIVVKNGALVARYNEILSKKELVDLIERLR